MKHEVLGTSVLGPYFALFGYPPPFLGRILTVMSKTISKAEQASDGEQGKGAAVGLTRERDPLSMLPSPAHVSIKGW